MSKPAVRIATIGIAVGLMVMLIAVAVVCGFRKEIQEKIIGFGSHIQVTSFENNNSYETSPIIVDSTIEQTIRNIEGVRHIQKFATKPGIIKTENDFQGIILKGIDHEFDWNFFASNMVEGDKIELHPDSANSTNVVISKILSDMLHLKVGDGFITYFIQNNVKARKFNVVGIYSTDFKDFDKMFILCDLRQVQKLNDWERDEFSGIEVLVNNYKQTDLIADKI
ncbi:MAG: ABC transporter permease, partial [Paludibacteraceae bacterium]|nr:ABC transporter permease [Paludibacteraceae bacterium]